MRLRRRRGYISSPEEMIISKVPSGYAPGVSLDPTGSIRDDIERGIELITSSGSTAGTWSVDGGPAIPYNATPAEAEQIDPEGMAKIVALGVLRARFER